MAVAAFITSVPLMIWEITVRRVRLADWGRPSGARLCGAWTGLRRAAHVHARSRTDRTGPGRRVRQSGAGVRRHHGGCHLGRALRPLSCPRAIVSCRRHRHCAKKLGRPLNVRAPLKPKEIEMAWIELKPEGAGPIRAWRADPVGKTARRNRRHPGDFWRQFAYPRRHGPVRGRRLPRGRAGDFRACRA